MNILKKMSVGTVLGTSGALLCLVCLMLFPEEIAQGIKSGFILLGSNIIPSLFPFMVVSVYISQSSAVYIAGKIFEKPSNLLFGVSGKGFTSVLLGFLGGYPIGAQVVSDLYLSQQISESETRKLLCWCVNPGPAFVITAVGKFMLGSTYAGVILYISVILSSITLGIATKIIADNDLNFKETPVLHTEKKNIFVNSVSSASNAMLSICGWVLTFSALCAGVECVVKNSQGAIFIKSISEVTTGCREGAACNLPLPVIAAILSFGGFAVIFQVAPYLEKCKFSIKLFTAIRVINGALSAFYCSLILKIFPKTAEVYAVLDIGNKTVHLSHSMSAGIILIIMCIVLILEVDYKKKIC